MRRISYVFALAAAVAISACSSSPTAPAAREFDAAGDRAATDVVPTDTTKKAGFVIHQ